jgi:tetratricopeptide (TPR) repeat protein/predicted Ser/Thr protein kinase
VSCPSDDTLVAMIEHALPPPAFAALEKHLDTCESCRKVVAAAATAQGLAAGTLPPDNVTAPVLPAGARYEIEKQLGSGGMGTVYLARDKSLGREVALKVHRAGSGHDRLHREAIAMAKLAHPNVVTVFEVTSIDDRLSVAMEYVRGTTLRGWLKADERHWRDTVAMLLGAGAGLAAAHDAGLVHRDFKPENVLVGTDGRPRVGDFGLARVGAELVAPPKDDVMLSLTTPMTVTGTVLGTPAYMSPEQLGGEIVDARADQFAFCVVAWECLYGKRPFSGNTLAMLQMAIEKQELDAPKDLGVPERVRAVLARGLAIEPRDRYADMHALLAALRQTALPRTRRRAAIAAIAVLATGGAAVAGTRTYESHKHAAACTSLGDGIRSRVVDLSAVQRAFAATQSTNAASAFDRTSKVLEKSADALALQAVATCRNNDDDPPKLANARRACFAAHDSAIANLIDLLSHADGPLVRRAPEAAWAIFDPHPCDDTAALLAAPERTPHTPADTAMLSRVRALEGVGHYKEARGLAQQLVDSAHAAGSKDMELEALIALGELRAHLETPDKVAPIDHQVLALAEAQGRDLEVAIALNNLANLAGVVQHDHLGAHRYIELARAKLARLGGNNLAGRGALLATETQVLIDENRLGEAETTAREAVSVLEQALGPDHPKVGNALGILSQTLRFQGKAAEALPVAERTLDVLTRALGEDHPTVAGSQMNLASSLIDLKRYPEARERLLKADAVFAKAFGQNHPTRAAIYGNLGQLEQMQEHWDAAIAAYRTALGVLEAIHDQAGAAAAHGDIARVLTLTGKHDEAIAEQDKGIALYESMGENGQVRLAPALADLAGMHLDANHPERALPIAERAVRVAEARPADANPGDLADARFALAAALWGTHGDRVRAKKLAEQARDAQPDAEKKAATVKWLAEHH